MKKRILAAILAAAMLVSMTACGQASKATDEPSVDGGAMAGMGNPNLYDITADEASEYTGFPLNAPADAENVMYNVIGYEDETPMAETTFTADGKEYTLRAVASDMTELYTQPAADAAASDITGLLGDIDMESIDISGIYTEWNAYGTCNVADFDGIQMNDNEYAVVTWLDTADGRLYNLSTADYEKTEDIEAMVALANSLYA